MANFIEFSMFKPSCQKRLFSGEPGSSVGIATDYGLDGPGSNPGGDEIFRPGAHSASYKMGKVQVKQSHFRPRRAQRVLGN